MVAWVASTPTVALLEKRRVLYHPSGDFPQVILIIPSHVPNTCTYTLVSKMITGGDGWLSKGDGFLNREMAG